MPLTIDGSNLRPGSVPAGVFDPADGGILIAWDNATAYALNDFVVHNNKLWIANAATGAGDEPGVDVKWTASGFGQIADGTTTNALPTWDGATWTEAASATLLDGALTLGDVSNDGRLIVQNDSSESLLDVNTTAGNVTIGSSGLPGNLRLTNAAGSVTIQLDGDTAIISGLSTPTVGNHAANMQYVDDEIDNRIAQGTVTNQLATWDGSTWTPNTGITAASGALLVGESGTAGSLSVRDAASIQNFSVASTGQVVSGSATVAGRIDINSPSGLVSMVVQAAGVMSVGTGNLLLLDGNGAQITLGDASNVGTLTLDEGAGAGTVDLTTDGTDLLIDGSPLALVAYVDAQIAAVAAGFDPKASCRVSTDTYLDNVGNGVWTTSGSGVGKTLTAGVAGTTTIDGTLLADGDRVYVWQEDGSSVNLDNVDHGIYVVSDAGAGTQTVLTRASDFDGSPSNEVSGGAYCFIETGTVYEGAQLVVLADGDVTVDTDPIVVTLSNLAPPLPTPASNSILVDDQAGNYTNSTLVKVDDPSAEITIGDASNAGSIVIDEGAGAGTITLTTDGTDLLVDGSPVGGGGGYTPTAESTLLVSDETSPGVFEYVEDNTVQILTASSRVQLNDADISINAGTTHQILRTFKDFTHVLIGDNDAGLTETADLVLQSKNGIVGLSINSAGELTTAKGNFFAVPKTLTKYLIYTEEAGQIIGLTEKVTPVAGDLLLIEDSADSNNKKKVQIGNLPGGSSNVDDGNMTGQLSAWNGSTMKYEPVADSYLQAGGATIVLEIGGSTYKGDVFIADNAGNNNIWLDGGGTGNAKVIVGQGGGTNTGELVLYENDGSFFTMSKNGNRVEVDYSGGPTRQLAHTDEIGNDADAIHDNVTGEIAAITEKVTPIPADLLLIEDSAAGNAKKRVQIGNLPSGGGGNIDNGTVTGQSVFWNNTSGKWEAESGFNDDGTFWNFGGAGGRNGFVTIQPSGGGIGIQLTANGSTAQMIVGSTSNNWPGRITIQDNTFAVQLEVGGGSGTLAIGASYNPPVNDFDAAPKRYVDRPSIRTIVTNDNASANDYTILGNAAGTITVTLPDPAASNEGKIYNLKNIHATGTLDVTTTSGTATIDGLATVSLSSQYQAIQVQSDGTNYHAISTA